MSVDAVPLQPFCKLADASTYVACDWDLREDRAGREHWVEFFKSHVNTIFKLGTLAATARGESEASCVARADACREVFYEEFDRFSANFENFGRVTILTLDVWRDRLLRQFGFVDAFVDLKARENEKMLPMLPGVCREFDDTDENARARLAVEGVFAGNIFDMGAKETAARFIAGSPDFHDVRATLPTRPWLFDDFDAFAARMARSDRYRKAVFFIDNAGSDFLLGALPFIRWLAQRGTAVVLAANERPTLNDMTIGDVHEWWPRVLAIEPSFVDLPIELVSTGTGEPLIDLLGVSAELNAAAADADLVILEGMGRGVESNLHAKFSCDAMNLAMIKDTAVAKRQGGKVFDVVCRYREAFV